MHILTLLIFLNLHNPLQKLTHSGKCGVTPDKAYSQNVLGRNVGYYVEIKNESEKEFDAIEWEAFFYDNFDELLETRPGSWSSGNIIKPCKPQETLKDLDMVWVKKATKVIIKIRRVHFTDGTTCGSKNRNSGK